MTEQQPTNGMPPEPRVNNGACVTPLPAGDAATSAANAQTTANKLTPEEQMALYEENLKENDWGHQPC